MITLTENALNHIKKFQSQEKKEGWGLRIAVVGGGCSGMSYKLDFQEAPQDSDKTLDQEGIKIFVDAKSALFLKGMVLDYSGGLNGTGFQFQNPNATKSCGCGSSFAV